MLKPTRKTITKEQFRILREARRLIKLEFDAPFSLQSDTLMRDLYGFALRSENDELFDLFGEVNPTTEAPIEQPLDKSQFVMLREARHLVASEFQAELTLHDADVIDALNDFALRSETEELFDILTFLSSRPGAISLDPANPVLTGAQFAKLHAAKRLVKAEFNKDLSLTSDNVMDDLQAFALRSKNEALNDVVERLQAETSPPANTAINFHSLDVHRFEQLRAAKRTIVDELDVIFSLHSATALDDLYRFALRSDGDELFDLFTELTITLPKQTPTSNPAWLSKEQFLLLRSARQSIRSEFDEVLELESETVLDELYTFALRSEEEQLFDIYSELHALSLPAGADIATAGAAGDGPMSKAHFTMLRKARSLIKEEFSEELQLQSDLVQADLYKFALRSDADDLFDLHASLAELAATTSDGSLTPTQTLTKKEFSVLRIARGLVKEEFEVELALESADVLDRLYEFALQSDGERLFDLHAQLNEQAAAAKPPQVQAAAPAPEPATVVSPDIVPEPQLEADTETPLKRIMSLFGNKPDTLQPDGLPIEREQSPDTVLRGDLSSAETIIGSGIDGNGPLDKSHKPAASAPKAHMPDAAERAARRRRVESLIERAITSEPLPGASTAAQESDAPEDDAVPVLVDEVSFEKQGPARSSTTLRQAVKSMQVKSESFSNLAVDGGNTVAVEEIELQDALSPATPEPLGTARGPGADQPPTTPLGGDKHSGAATWYLSSLDGRLGVELQKGTAHRHAGWRAADRRAQQRRAARGHRRRQRQSDAGRQK